MCRLLLVQSRQPLNPAVYLEPFADACRASREYQGHGWGITSHTTDPSATWDRYRTLTPIWDDDLAQLGTTRSFLAHARSAFRDEDIAVENNMPFVAGRWSYGFNGELRGVRVRAPGRTGAARIWNMIQRAQTSAGLSMHEAIERTVAVLVRQSVYVRAMNIFITDGENALVHSSFNESPDYFTLHHCSTGNDDVRIVSSEPFALPAHGASSAEETPRWIPVPNHSTMAWQTA
jgi:glutamine amidotransferase